MNAKFSFLHENRFHFICFSKLLWNSAQCTLCYWCRRFFPSFSFILNSYLFPVYFFLYRCLSLSISFIRASENKFLLIFHRNESYQRFIQHNSSKYFSSFHSLHLCLEHLDFRFYYYSTDHALCILRMTLLQVHVIWNLFGDSVGYLENWTSVAGAKINGKSNEQVQNLKKIP